MRLIGVLVLAVVAAMAAAAPRAQQQRPQIRFLCGRPECSCEEQEGFELVTCDCSDAGSGEVSVPWRAGTTPNCAAGAGRYPPTTWLDTPLGERGG